MSISCSWFLIFINSSQAIKKSFSFQYQNMTQLKRNIQLEMAHVRPLLSHNDKFQTRILPTTHHRTDIHSLLNSKTYSKCI